MSFKGNDDLLDDIDELLGRSPDSVRSGIPEIKLHLEGNTTVIENILPILNRLKRDIKYFKKYISSALGVKTKFKGDQLILYSKISRDKIIGVFDRYIQKYVICTNCRKPDTVMTIKSKNSIEIQCLACGYLNTIE